jgi:uncharacterized membrane protein YfhO
MSKKNNRPAAKQFSKNSNSDVVPNSSSDAAPPSVSSELSIITNANALYIVFALLLVANGWVFLDFLFGGKLFMFKDIGSDTINQIYPFAKMMSEALQEGFPTWSFRQGLGQYIAPFNMGNPFHLVLYFLGQDNLPYAIGLIEFIKFVVSGLVFYGYLCQLKLSPLARIFGGMAFGLSAYLANSAGWYTFFTGWAIEFAFLLFALEKLLQASKWYYLPVAVALIAIDQPFNLFLFSEFSFLYLLARHLSNENPQHKSFGLGMLKIIGLGIFGLCIGAAIFSGNIYSILNSPRVTGGASYFDVLKAKSVLDILDVKQLYTVITRFFSNNLVGNGQKYAGWANYLEAPSFYMGLFVLLLAPQIFLQVEKRKQYVYGIVSFLILIVLVFPYFRYAIWAFSGDYYRLLSLFVGVVFLLGALQVITLIQKGKEINIWLLLATYGILIYALFYEYSEDWNSIIQLTERTRVVLFLTVLTALLCLYKFVKKEFVLILILLVSFLEAAISTHQTLNKRDLISRNEWKERSGYNDYSKEALAFIQAKDKGFYRIEKNYSSGPSTFRSNNDGMVQGYNGTSVYTAFNHKNQVLFMGALNMLDPKVEFDTRWVSGLRNRPFALSNVGVKYALIKGKNEFKNFAYDSLAKFEDVLIVENPNYLPLGFTYDSYFKDSFFKTLSPLQKDFALMRGFVINDAESAKFSKFKELRDSIPIPPISAIKTMSDKLKEEVFKIRSFSNTHFEGSIELFNPKLMYLAIPFDEGWKVTVDGKAVQPMLVTYGMIGIEMEKGKHEVKLNYEAPYLKSSAYLSLASIFVFIGAILFFGRKKSE